MNKVYTVSSLYCDYDNDVVLRGVFSTYEKALQYIEDNNTVVEVENVDTSVCASNRYRKGSKKVYQSYGYDVKSNLVKKELNNKDKWDYYIEFPTTVNNERVIGKDYLSTQTCFTINEVILDYEK